MALKPCRECRELVSTEAKACPTCGASRPTGLSPGQRLKVIFSLLMVGGVFWCTAETYISSEEEVRAAKPPLDHQRPWFARDRAAMCASKADLAGLRDNAVMETTHSLRERKRVACWSAREGEPVTEVDHDGSFRPDYLVRLDTGSLAWMQTIGLRN